MNRYFIVPAVMTAGMFAWWLRALTTTIHFPGRSGHGYTNMNAVGFNIVLFVIVGLSWLGARALAGRASSSGKP